MEDKKKMKFPAKGAKDKKPGDKMPMAKDDKEQSMANAVDKPSTPDLTLGDKDQSKPSADNKEAAPIEPQEQNKSDSKPAPEESDMGMNESPEHSDEEQDKKLIADMIQKILGQDMQYDEVSSEMAKEAYDGFKEMGYTEQDAITCAGHAVKLAKHLAGKEMKQADSAEADQATESEKGDEMEPKKTDAPAVEATKENDKIVKMEGEIASLRESLKTRDIQDHAALKLKEVGLESDSLKESIKACKSTEEVDKTIGLFMEGYKSGHDGKQAGVVLSIAPEKPGTTSGTKNLLAGCVKN